MNRINSALILVSVGVMAGCGPTAGGGGREDGAALLPDSHVGQPDAGNSIGGDAGPCWPPCDQPGALRCSTMSTNVQQCEQASPGCMKWETTESCASQGMLCEDQGGTPACVAPSTCTDGIQNQDETDVDCGGQCAPCAVGLGCGGDDDCDSGACTNGVCVTCHATTHRCYGNYLQECAADESGWNDLSHCDPQQWQVCDPAAVSCHTSQPIGNGPSNTTGEYYQYAEFCTSGGVFQGGFDIGSLGDKLYVNRDGQHIDVYQVLISDSDGDGVIEPNQHPDNPNAQGPMEARQLQFVQTYDVPIANGAFTTCTGGWVICSNEIQPTTDVLYFLSQWDARIGISTFDIATSQTQLLVPWPTGLGCNEVLGHNALDDIWYVATYERRVFSYHQPTAEWVLEFSYPNLSGEHTDGLEVVRDPGSGIPYVYVSDMTSDYIGQYAKQADGTWVQTNLFRYNRGGGDFIEGMGFGALGHFWMSAVVNPSDIYGTNCIYEIGGGDISSYVEPWDPTHQ